jgi:hypothetical protein
MTREQWQATAMAIHNSFPLLMLLSIPSINGDLLAKM